MRRNLIACTAALSLCLSGCGTLKPGADPVAVNAEKTTQVAFDVFSTYVHLEYAHKAEMASLIGPGAHKLGNDIRLHGREWLQSARALTAAYEANRTPQNKASMLTAIVVVEAALSQAQAYILQYQGH